MQPGLAVSEVSALDVAPALLERDTIEDGRLREQDGPRALRRNKKCERSKARGMGM